MIKKIQTILIVTCLAFMINIQNLSANDEGLYDPLPPQGSAFVRLITHPDYAGDLHVTLNAKTYAINEKASFTEYYVVPKGEVTLQSGVLSFTVDEGVLYSVFLMPTGAKVLIDPGHENMKKAQIIAYNLSSYQNISLKTANGKVDIIKDLKHLSVDMRAINPVKIQTALFAGDKKITTLPDLSMERGRSYSLAIFNDGDNIRWVENKTSTRQ